MHMLHEVECGCLQTNQIGQLEKVKHKKPTRNLGQRKINLNFKEHQSVLLAKHAYID